jgi:tetratricopeptide (TPR) repeat protein
VLNSPNLGGYLQWMLAPRYRIFMDMEIPFLFTDEDMFVASHMFSKPGVLRGVLARYHPAFLTVPRTAQDFPALIKELPAYQLVFFDDADALYVDRERHPDLAERYALRALDPFDLSRRGVEGWLKGDDDAAPGAATAKPDAQALAAALEEAGRLLAIFPDGGTANHLLAQASLDRHEYAGALAPAQALVRNFPESALGYVLMGDALGGLQRFDGALAAYTAAVGKARPSARYGIYASMGRVYLEQGRPARAYRLLKSGVDVMDSGTPDEDLYRLLIATRLTGRRRDAARLLSYLERRVPPGDAAWAAQLAEERRRLAGGSP